MVELVINRAVQYTLGEGR